MTIATNRHTQLQTS